jgi:hypothetical protein
MLANALDTTGSEQSEKLADWTPEQQMAHMLDLCEAQMESALSESDLAVDALIKAFSGLVDTARSVSAMTEGLPAELKQVAAGNLNQQVEAISKQMAAAVVAFQFYDKLTQRLGHVRYSLSTLAMFVCDRAQTTQRDQWRRLFVTLRRLYRTEEERQIFNMMVEGATADEAREHIHQSTATMRAMPTATASGEIELF